MKDLISPDVALQDAVRTYCHALHAGDGAAIEALCDARFLLHWVGAAGVGTMDKAAFVARVGGRDAFPGVPEFEVLSVDVAGDQMAQVKLNVRVPPRLFTDQLGFLWAGGEWRLMTKLCRVADGPAMEG